MKTKYKKIIYNVGFVLLFAMIIIFTIDKGVDLYYYFFYSLNDEKIEESAKVGEVSKMYTKGLSFYIVMDKTPYRVYEREWIRLSEGDMIHYNSHYNRAYNIQKTDD